MLSLKKSVFFLLIFCFSGITTFSQTDLKDCKRCIVLAEQLEHRVAIADVDKNEIIWEWKPGESNIKPDHVNWFNNISEAKPVYNLKYILTTASGGGVALIRVADKKTVFYAYAGGNTHSAEMLPDGIIVSASSTGNFLTLFKVDTLNFPERVYTKNIPVPFGHNVVWDKKREVLWTAAMDKMLVFKYNYNCNNPDLKLIDSFPLPDTEAHDLFPVYNRNQLWLTDTGAVHTFDLKTRKFSKVSFSKAHIKSITSADRPLPIIMLKPKEKWWSDTVIDSNGNTVFHMNGLRIYKARWFIDNQFSYSTKNTINICN